MDQLVNISTAAQEYLVQLLAKEDPGCGIRIFVAEPGTPRAETCIAYCRKGEEHPGDQPYEYNGFTVWYDERSIPFLENAEVDFREDRMGGQITVKAPNSRVPQVGPDAPIEDRVNYVLYSEINPALASHGGMVSLMEVTKDNVAVLMFGGGCQGCAAIDITLKQGVETTLRDRIPELKGIQDATDHSYTANAYY